MANDNHKPMNHNSRNNSSYNRAKANARFTFNGEASVPIPKFMLLALREYLGRLTLSELTEAFTKHSGLTHSEAEMAADAIILFYADIVRPITDKE